jgi:imidazolonepropionase-like amidohydrolase
MLLSFHSGPASAACAHSGIMDGIPGIQTAWTTGLWKRQPDFNRQLIQALYKVSVPIMAGTEAMGAPLIIPGISLHKELQLLAESGLTGYDVLWTATVGPARFINRENEFGSITEGKRTDLVLVAENPLENPAALQKINGVIVNGVWLDKNKLQELLEGLRSEPVKEGTPD